MFRHANVIVFNQRAAVCGEDTGRGSDQIKKKKNLEPPETGVEF